jgi:hypothetical protein
MARLLTTALTKQDMADYVKTADDFHFELQVYNLCARHGLDASHGGTYIDSVTGKARQFDIRASLTQGLVKLNLAVECKNLKPFYPLLVSTIPRLKGESFHEVVLSYPNFAVRRPPAFIKRLSYDDSIYPVNENVGKTLGQVGKTVLKEFTQDDAEVYDRWSQAVASARDLIAESVFIGQKTSRPIVTFTMPVLVVANDSLWTANYSTEGVLQREPSAVESATLFLARSYTVDAKHPAYEGTLDCTISHLHIFTLNGLEAFLQQLRGILWNEIFPGSVNQLVAGMHK